MNFARDKFLFVFSTKRQGQRAMRVALLALILTTLPPINPSVTADAAASR
jgi:hypothetical protein